MARSGLPLLIAAGFLSLVACSTTPREPVVASPPPADKARLYIYRDATTYGSQIWSAVSLNGQVVGSSAPGTVFYRDLAPGTAEVEVRSDRFSPGQSRMVTLAAGSTTFVKIEEQSWSQSGFGIKTTSFIVAIIDPAIGPTEISRLRLVLG